MHCRILGDKEFHFLPFNLKKEKGMALILFQNLDLRNTYIHTNPRRKFGEALLLIPECLMYLEFLKH